MSTNLIARLQQNILKKFRETFAIDQRYRIGNADIRLPPSHLLPTYQRRFPQYDRFLPHLAQYLDADSVVIDVGANVGDTVAAMASKNRRLKYLCVEADDEFFAYLLENINKINAAYDSITILTCKALVGLNVSSKALTGSGGTKRVVEAGEAEQAQVIPTRTLDDIFQSQGQSSALSLIKSDVDGFDFDVIDSAHGIIQSHLPLIFFECDYLEARQYEGYKRSIQQLADFGYHKFAVFDNFGALVAPRIDMNSLLEMLNYVSRQGDGESTRTINYFDVLAYSDKHLATVTDVLDSY